MPETWCRITIAAEEPGVLWVKAGQLDDLIIGLAMQGRHVTRVERYDPRDLEELETQREIDRYREGGWWRGEPES